MRLKLFKHQVSFFSNKYNLLKLGGEYGYFYSLSFHVFFYAHPPPPGKFKIKKHNKLLKLGTSLSRAFFWFCSFGWYTFIFWVSSFKRLPLSKALYLSVTKPLEKGGGCLSVSVYSSALIWFSFALFFSCSLVPCKSGGV